MAKSIFERSIEQSKPEEERCPKCNDRDYIPIIVDGKKKMVCLNVNPECNYEKEI